MRVAAILPGSLSVKRGLAADCLHDLECRDEVFVHLLRWRRVGC
jgi:hypothetical protein